MQPTSELQYKFVEIYSYDECIELRDKLKAFNVSHIGEYAARNYIFSYRDANNNLVAGLYAYYNLGIFFIDLLWVDETYRLHKLGSNLIKEAEERARQDGALYVRLNTATFQALGFYRKLGYAVFAELPLLIKNKDMGREILDYYLIKYLNG